MRGILCSAVACLVLVLGSDAQQAGEKPQPHHSVQSEERSASAPSASDTDDVAQLRQDLERLKVLLNQMRTNLAFVQTSQTPLKHQFELEADAWQVIVEQMDRRVKRMEDRSARESGR